VRGHNDLGWEVTDGSEPFLPSLRHKTPISFNVNIITSFVELDFEVEEHKKVGCAK
jgi:hypothetical protein